MVGAGRVGTQLVEQATNDPDDVDVGLLAAAAHVVSLAGAPAREHLAQRAAVIAHVEPVAYLQTVAVDRQRLAGQGVAQH